MIKIDYELVRSHRKTLCISVCNNKVIVRAPMRMPVAKIEDFVRQKGDWIVKQLAKSPDYEKLSSYKYIYVKGLLVPLTVGEKNRISQDGVTVRKITDLKKLYIKEFGEEFLNLLKEVSKGCGLQAKSVQFKPYKSRWGCCDSKKNIIFNYKLLMLPIDLWRCVIVHELCHTVFMDHSKNFRMLVCTVMPDYLTVHKKLKAFSAVTRLF